MAYTHEPHLRRVPDPCDHDPDRTVVQVRCCGVWLDCTGFTNTCDTCGSDYNWAGQALAPRECWGEETGESYADLSDL